MKKDWSGRTAVITGASSGLGASFAVFLASKGIHVVLTARRGDRLEKIQKEIRAHGGNVTVYQADLAVEKDREHLAEKIKTNIGQVDILINNAGFGWYGFFNEMSWKLAQEMIDVNMGAAAHLTRLFLPEMLARKSGHIINIGSIAGGLPNQGIAIYSASKAFLDAFATSLFRELKDTGVQISVMRLGPVKTEFYDTAREQENGGDVPAKKFAISTDRVNKSLWELINHPKRFVYVPGWLFVTKFVENMFGWAIDLLGPLLLKRKK